MVATFSQKKAISTMFCCELASGSEVQLCFYTSYCARDTRDSRLSLMHTCFSRGCLSSWDRIWLKRRVHDRPARHHTLNIWSGLNAGNVPRIFDLCHFRRNTLPQTFYRHHKRVSSRSGDSSPSFPNPQKLCQEFFWLFFYDVL